MIRKNITITEKQKKKLAEHKKKTGMCDSELIRRLLDEYFAKRRTSK